MFYFGNGLTVVALACHDESKEALLLQMIGVIVASMGFE